MEYPIIAVIVKRGQKSCSKSKKVIKTCKKVHLILYGSFLNKTFLVGSNESNFQNMCLAITCVVLT